MLEYGRTEVSKVIEVNEVSRTCIICNCLYFLKVNFRFQLKVCDGFHDLIQKVASFVAIVFVNRNDYRILFLDVSKDEVVNLF